MGYFVVALNAGRMRVGMVLLTLQARSKMTIQPLSRFLLFAGAEAHHALRSKFDIVSVYGSQTSNDSKNLKLLKVVA